MMNLAMVPKGSELPPASQGWFTTTHWSVVLQAKQGDSECAANALAKLCQFYWPPIYAYLRRRSHQPADAEDLTQSFFAHLLEQDFLEHLRHRQGKFRSFLLTFLKHFLSDERARVAAQKRGGGKSFISLDALESEKRDAVEPKDALTPDQAFERRWAEAVMAQAAERLRADYAARGQSALFEQLKDLQPGEHGERNYAQLGIALSMTEQAVKNAVHSFRRRYARSLREQVAQTVAEAGEVQEELQHLLRVFAR